MGGTPEAKNKEEIENNDFRQDFTLFNSCFTVCSKNDENRFPHESSFSRYKHVELAC